MPQTDLKSLTRAYAQAFGARDAAAVAALLHDDVILDDPGAGRVSGKDAVMALNQGIFDSCRDMACDVRSILADGTATALEFIIVLDGTRVGGTDIIEWRDGRIAAIRAYVNP